MALDDETSSQTQLMTPFRWPNRRRITLRRRKLPTLRLGSKKSRRGLSLSGMFRKVRLRWLKLQYTCMLRKIKNYYRNIIKDLNEAGATIEAFHQRIVMEASLAVPVMGFSVYPSVTAANRRFV